VDLRQVARRAVTASSLLLGFEPLRVFRTLQGAPRFLRDAAEFRAKATGAHFPFKLSNLRPIVLDWAESAGTAGGHYFHQDLWAARKIFAARPKKHMDVGSRIDGFVAHVLTFMPVTVIDIRALHSNIDGLTFFQQDATTLSDIPTSSVESISSLHAIEHFGLGRYGDPIDPDACFAAMRSLARVVRPGGRVYFSVPMGVERVEFNAQRVFAPRTVLDTFSDLELVSFSAVDDAGDLVHGAPPSEFARSRNACGLFEFTKRAVS